ncbi:acyltransferase [Rhizobium sp. RM]|uniref:acyltransferase family protein n=1 Tax=Rhizobium sp. RM TaxID=2748079 RepID=UPI00110E5E72|nr:acyltransferase [Rhizobium sp. RM]NWJ23871.1 acyltransferase [Rhizobium sp. RM]TMV19687.1 acyltransferase [Rhizobium sp. Td3]
MIAETPKSQSRFVYIDCVRGVAALYVLLQHAFEYAGFISVKGEGPYNWFANFGQAGVFAFFLVSGFVIPFSLERSKSTSDFWVKRVARIYPLYLFIFAATFLTRTFIEGIPVERPLEMFFGQLFFLNSWIGLEDYVGGSWTLVIEFMWYIGLFLWWRAAGGIRPRLLLCVALALSIVVTVIAVSFPVRVPLGRLGMMLACCWGLFILEYTKGTFSRQQFWWINLVFVAVSATILYVGFGLRPSRRLAEMLPFSVALASWGIGAITFFFFYVFQKSSLVCNSWLARLGTISYSVYLVHPVLLSTLVYLGMTGYPLLVIGIGMTIVAATLTYRFVEKPFISSSHKHKQKLQTKAA